jgi:hypothetical protein
MAAQVALKRQQAAEDAIAINLRCLSPNGQLPPGPVFGDQNLKIVDENPRKSNYSSSYCETEFILLKTISGQ